MLSWSWQELFIETGWNLFPSLGSLSEKQRGAPSCWRRSARQEHIFFVCIVLLTRPLIHSIFKNEAPFSGQKIGKFICRNSVERSIRYWQDRSYLETDIVLRLWPFMWVGMLMMMMMMVLMKMKIASQFLSWDPSYDLFDLGRRLSLAHQSVLWVWSVHALHSIREH